MPVRNVVLHIGASKCGSTFIQNFVNENSSYMYEHDISLMPHEFSGSPGKKWIPTIFRGTSDDARLPVWDRLGVTQLRPPERKKTIPKKNFFDQRVDQ